MDARSPTAWTRWRACVPGVPGTWRVLALAYASRMGLRGQHFLGHDERSQDPHPTAYFVWLAVSDTDAVLVDAGIGPARAASTAGLHYFGSPIELLARLGVAPEHIGWSVLTHLHYDHTGVVADLPSAHLRRPAGGTRLLDRAVGRSHHAGTVAVLSGRRGPPDRRRGARPAPRGRR